MQFCRVLVLAFLYMCDGHPHIYTRSGTQRADVAHYEQVNEGFPFIVNKAEMDVNADGSIVARIEFTSDVLVYLLWEESYFDYLPFIDVNGGSSTETLCIHSADYSCRSSIYIRHPRDREQFSALISVRNDGGSYIFKHVFQYHPIRMQDWPFPASWTPLAPVFSAHPPAVVHFKPGQDVSLYWQFEQPNEWKALIYYYRYPHLEENMSSLASFVGVTNETVSYTIENIDLQFIPERLANEMIRFNVHILIHSAMADDAGVIKLLTGQTDYEMEVELAVSGQISAFPTGVPIMTFRSCAHRQRTIATPDMELCLRCSVKGQDIAEVTLLHEGEVVEPSEELILTMSPHAPGVQELYYIIRKPTVGEDGGEYSCKATTTGSDMQEKTIQTVVLAELPEVTEFNIIHRDEEKIIFECDAHDSEGLNSILQLRWYRDMPSDPSSQPMMEEMFVREDTSEGPFTMQVQHEEGSLHWHALFELDLTAISFGPQLSDFTGCELASDQYVAGKYLHDLSDED